MLSVAQAAQQAPDQVILLRAVAVRATPSVALTAAFSSVPPSEPVSCNGELGAFQHLLAVSSGAPGPALGQRSVPAWHVKAFLPKLRVSYCVSHHTGAGVPVNAIPNGQTCTAGGTPCASGNCLDDGLVGEESACESLSGDA